MPTKLKKSIKAFTLGSNFLKKKTLAEVNEDKQVLLNNIPTNIRNKSSEKLKKRDPALHGSLSVSCINNIDETKPHFMKSVVRLERMSSDIQTPVKSKKIPEVQIQSSSGKKSTLKSKSDASSPMKIFARGIKKMIEKTCQWPEVTKSNLKEILMAPMQSIGEFVEEKNRTIAQESLMKIFLND